jgi:spoIIIJ-associated protein
MEWVETTGKTVDEAKELALDQLGVAADEAEFEIVEAPRPGLFGRLRGEARVRSRVRPAELRPKRDRRRRKEKPDEEESVTSEHDQLAGEATPTVTSAPAPQSRAPRPTPDPSQETAPEEPDASPDEVGAAAVKFVSGLVEAMGFEATTSLQSNGTELDVVVNGQQLGLLIGPGGRTLLSIQNLARVAAQRRLGDHDTRLRVDVAGYRARRKAALEEFAAKLVADVKTSGVSRALEPMPSVDRKIIHDALSGVDGVSSRSEGDDPYRRVIVSPASTGDS